MEQPFAKLGLATEFKEGDVDKLIENWCTNAHNSGWLDRLVIVCIMVNTLVLAASHPCNMFSDQLFRTVVHVDAVVTIIFSCEMFIRIIAMGFYNPSYTGRQEAPSLPPSLVVWQLHMVCGSVCYIARPTHVSCAEEEKTACI